MATLGFDVYGTLIDTQGVVEHLKSMIGDEAYQFSETWRNKQLEYSFRRGLMQNYVNFSVCTSQALDYTCHFHETSLSKDQKHHLLSAYSTLPTFADVQSTLVRLKEEGHDLFAFSNGTQEAVNALLDKAGIKTFFNGVISCDDLKSFKPNPGVYAHYLRQANANSHNAWLISSNPFDVIGAKSAGMHAAWVQRSTSTIFDPWELEPTITIRSLNDLCDALENHM